MDNSFFVFTDKESVIDIERFHICTWEFYNSTSLVEFGMEILKDSLKGDELSISMYIPWFTRECSTKDLYEKLSVPENSRFIFNDSVSGTDSLDGGKNKLGVIQKFADRKQLCILPLKFDISEEKIVTIKASLKPYNSYTASSKPNIYVRFWIDPKTSHISMRKNGISKSTVIYDIKVNERRNIPDELLSYFDDKQLCKIGTCFSFNIIPNKYDLVFFDSSSLKNIRTLEYDSFNKYLGDKRVKKDELIVVFNKKQNSESFSFFSIFSRERIGSGQFALAVLMNIVCGILLFIPSYRKTFSPELGLITVWKELPFEIYLSFTIALATVVYFVWPWIIGKLWYNPKRK
jgi:hypothetical protein